MECRTVEIQDYVYGFLEPQTRGGFEAHLTACAGCREAEARLRGERDLLRAAAATAPATGSRSRAPLLWIAAGVLGVVGLIGWVLSIRWPSWRRMDVPSLVPGGDTAPSATARSAIRATRAQRSYRAKFEATMQTSIGSVTIKGECVRVSPGVVYIQYTGSGGDQKRIIRIGEKVWIYHEVLGDWVTSEELGSPRAGRSFENADEVLAALDRGAPAGARNLRFSVPAAQFSDLIPFFDARAGAAVSVALTVAGERLSAITFTEATFSGGIWFERYNKDESMEFVAEGKPIPIPETIRKEIREFRERGR